MVIYGHTHRPSIRHDPGRPLLINPGEASGWTYRQPSFAMLDTATMQAEIIWLEP